MRTGFRTWTRSKVTAALSIAVVVVVSTMGSPSEAQEAPAAPTSANGAAKATAVLAKVAPGVGGLGLAVTSGVAVSQHQNALAEAQAQGLDLGLIGTTLTSEGCSGAAVTADDLPQPVRVDNRNGNASETKDDLPLGPAGGLRLSAAATTTPDGRSEAKGVGIEIPGLLDLGAGTSVAETRVLPDGKGREARAVVQTTLDIAGVINLRGMRWEALHRTGTERIVEGTFEILGSAEVGGIDLPLDDIEPVQAALNDLLEFTGLSIELPRVEKFTEPTDLVRVTPLRISFSESELGGLVLGPVLNASRPQREQLFADLAEAFCQAKSAGLLADVGIAIAAGSGFLTFEIGGAEALSGDFTVGGAIDVPPVATPTDPVAPVGGGVTPDLGGGPSIDPTTGDETAAPDVGGAAPVADVGPLERVCESVHPFEWPSCSEGAAPVAGLIGLAATGLMFGFDYRRQRSLLQPPAEEAAS